MKRINLSGSLKQITKNTQKLLSLAWKMDKNTTFLYYLTAGLGALVPLSASLILKLLIDHLQLIQNSFIPNIPLTVAFVLAARYLVTLLDGVIYWGANQGYLDYIFRYELQNEVTMKFHQKISKLDIAYFENPETQDLITKTRDTMQWRVPEYLRVLSLLFRDSVAFLAAFIVLLPYGWWIPLLVSAIALPRLYLQTRYGNVQWSIWGSGAPQARKLWYLNYLLQEPMTVRETRISQSSSSLLSKFKEIQTYLFQLNKKALDDYLRVSTIPPILETILIFLVAYQFLPQVTFGFLTVGSFTLIINMLEQLGNRAAGASARIGQLYENNLYLNHYFEFLGLPSIVKQTRKAVIFKKIEPPEIEFRNVSFAYRLGPKVLNNISIKIRSGENIALVGHNGAGKTTFVKLLCRFYDVTEGEILINGQNLKSLDLPNWYQHLGTLFQEFVKYHFSVRENITLGAPNKRDEKAMKQAALQSGAAEFIEKLPKKYDQILGREFEEGVELSGGQWQKLAIARAFYEEPPILILDEPTSAIDAEAEYEIFNNLGREYKNKTLILVSHRFSTVRNADKIYVLENGEIVESGSHNHLMELNREYAKLFSIQAQGYK